MPVTVRVLIPLYTVDLWRQNIDLIIDEVECTNDAAGHTPLREEDIPQYVAGNKEGFKNDDTLDIGDDS